MRTEGQRQSRKHEDRLAAKLSGTRTAASGAFWSRRGDVRTADLFIEHKFTGKKQYTLRSAVLRKAVQEAILEHRMPVFAVHLDGRDYVILCEDDFLELRERCQETQGESGNRTQMGLEIPGEVQGRGHGDVVPAQGQGPVPADCGEGKGDLLRQGRAPRVPRPHSLPA